MRMRKLPTLIYPKGVDVETLSAEELVDWLAREAIRLVKLLPVKSQRLEDKLCKRSIWKEFCALVKRGEISGNNIYQYYVVQKIVENVVATINGSEEMEKVWELSLARHDLTDDESESVQSPECAYAATQEIMRRVVLFGKESPIKNPYQEIKGLDFALNDPVFENVFSSNKVWAWLDIDQKFGMVEVLNMSPQAKCRRECKEIFGIEDKDKDKESMARGLAKTKKSVCSALPPIIESAIELAVFTDDFVSIVDFAKETKLAITSINESRKPNWDLVFNADPALYFKFARQPILDQRESRVFVDNMLRILDDICPNRQKPIAEMLLTIVRRLTGDQDAVYPLLHGPPGTAKTFLVEQLADAFNQAGIKTSYVHQAMTGSVHREANDVGMSLQGISSKWGNGRHGIIYSEIYQPDIKLTLVCLDEVDKCSLQDYMVSLLDPRQTFQDNYWRDFFTKIDMRSKVLFFGTANNVEVIRRGGTSPLWSRLAPIEMDAYTVNESIEIVAKLAFKRQSLGNTLNEREVLDISERIIRQYDGRALPSIRALIDQVNRELSLREYPSLERILSKQREEYRPPQGIGFASK